MGEMQLASKDLISIACLLAPLLKQIDIVVFCNSANSRTSELLMRAIRFGLIHRHGASHFSLLDFRYSGLSSLTQNMMISICF
jgi:hypothetical protein